MCNAISEIKVSILCNQSILSFMLIERIFNNTNKSVDRFVSIICYKLKLYPYQIYKSLLEIIGINFINNLYKIQ